MNFTRETGEKKDTGRVGRSSSSQDTKNPLPSRLFRSSSHRPELEEKWSEPLEKTMQRTSRNSEATSLRPHQLILESVERDEPLSTKTKTQREGVERDELSSMKAPPRIQRSNTLLRRSASLDSAGMEKPPHP